MLEDVPPALFLVDGYVLIVKIREQFLIKDFVVVQKGRRCHLADSVLNVPFMVARKRVIVNLQI